ncbi:MAG: sigma factor-like helix-turn-helix DNA-binding protein [Bacillota bacterium]|nr:sigma factor-like helix-turn-helix DNA-binding protein [Bacillota bacterium]
MSDILADREYILGLLSKYGVLLTETQRGIARSYYEYDLSLSEIAEENKISRAAVSEALKSSLAKMGDYEEKLGLLKKDGELKQKIDNALKKGDQDSYRSLLEEIVNGL